MMQTGDMITIHFEMLPKPRWWQFRKLARWRRYEALCDRNYRVEAVKCSTIKLDNPA